ncbi:2332_t:CDS:10 [Entrophospora sp. SA101]|nr:2332_t:CDS:10 [Entrophospora sp. SA101]
MDTIIVLALANEARNTYGLRHQDYTRYRQYCTQKIHRLRVSLKFTHGKGRFTQKNEVNVSSLNDVRVLHIVLFDTERAWSYAMELKRESRSTGDLRKKHHLIRKLKKAEKCAKQLEHLCSREIGKVDTRTVLEAQAYSSLMSGYLTIYEKLSAAGTSHQETLCQSAIDDIDPNIRFCAFKLRLGTDVEDLVKMTLGKNKGVGLDLLEAEVESVLTQSRQQKASFLNSITWHNRTVSLKNTDLAISILKAQDATKNLENALDSEAEDSTKMELFDALLEAYGDAENFAKNVVKEDAEATAKVKSSKSEKLTADLNFVYDYVAYNYLFHRIQRNLMLVETLKHNLKIQERSDAKFFGGKYQEIVKLYDNVLQSLNEINDLSEVQINLNLLQEIDAKTWYYKAWRVLYVASAYAVLNKELEAVLLYERAREYNAQAKASLSKITSNNSGNDDEILIVTQKDVDELENLLRAHKCKVHASRCLQHGTSYLLENLNQYPTNFSKTNARLIKFPPEFSPIPAKPLFFDIAYNYLDFPPNLSQRAGHKPTKESAIFGGLFKNILGQK